VRQSIRSRIGFSLFANLAKSTVTFCTGMLVARGLGPQEYGNMMFLLSTFMALRQLLDSGSSNAFFTFMAQKERSLRFVYLYFVWFVFQFILVLVAIGLFLPSVWVEFIWRGEQRSVIVLAFVVTYTQSALWTLMLQMGESQRLTNWVQSIGLSVTLTHFMFMLIAWWGGWLDVSIIFILLIIEWAIAAFLIGRKLQFNPNLSAGDEPRLVFSEFWRYCLPLIPYGVLSFVYEFVDRWMLQTYAGSVQQAQYAVASQFATIVGIATASIINIFWKEIAEAHHEFNTDRVSMLYKKFTRVLFFGASALSGMLSPWSKEILQLTLGSDYSAGSITLAIMFFYPIHQCIGQLGGTMAYATGRVSAFVKLNMIFMMLSIILTYFVLAPSDALIPGLELGSMGLASKMVLIQVIGVNVVALYLCRSLRISFDWIPQFLLILGCCASGLFAREISLFLLEPYDQILLKIISSWLIYIVILIGIIFIFPYVINFDRNELIERVVKFKKF
jgi:O-antigen/teichoic acid export membrane protein